jgi:hypothetical protein
MQTRGFDLHSVVGLLAAKALSMITNICAQGNPQCAAALARSEESLLYDYGETSNQQPPPTICDEPACRIRV